jgi:L-aspartate oxidase
VHDRFPLISEACREAGLDLARDRIPIGPAAHYVMGGVQTDIDGLTSIPGLYAAGEVACTGVHGANRLASNSLLEGLVFGARAGRAMRASGVQTGGRADGPLTSRTRTAASEARRAADEELPSTEDVQARMWRDVGLFRDRIGLSSTLSHLEPAWAAIDAAIRDGVALDADGWRRASVLTVGRLIARAALRREESRGGHFRSDYPQRDDIHWKRRASETRDAS